mgnify:CR=1 FL=1
MYGYTLDVQNPVIDMLLKGCKKELSTSARPKAPLEPVHLVLIQNLIDHGNPKHRMFYAAVVTQFFACLRKSNLLPPSLRTFSAFKHLTRGDFHFVPGAMVLTIPWSKTLQNKSDIMTIPIADVPQAVLNPVQIYKQFIHDFPLPFPKLPAFAYLSKGKLVVLTQSEYVEMLKACYTV